MGQELVKKVKITASTVSLETQQKSLGKKAVVCNCLVNLIKDVYAENQFLKCHNLQ